MNKKQKTCLLIGITAIVVMGLYPPWVLETKELWAGKVKYTLEPGPYSWIGDPPVTAKFIDLYRLCVQFFVVAVVTAGLIIIFRDEKATKQ